MQVTYSICYGNEGASLSLDVHRYVVKQIYKILFSIYFLYRYASGKCEHTNKGIFFREVACTRHHVPFFAKHLLSDN
jgi:hypothetical protein